MKNWKIPVVWQSFGVVSVVADTLKEAVAIVRDDDTIPLPDVSEYIEESFEVSTNDIEAIRECYNHNQKDED